MLQRFWVLTTVSGTHAVCSAVQTTKPVKLCYCSEQKALAVKNPQTDLKLKPPLCVNWNSQFSHMVSQILESERSIINTIKYLTGPKLNSLIN